MSVNYIINGDTLKDIADAIREKKETSAPIDVSDFANEILTISGGSSTLISKTITENGTYNASDDHADGYSDVTVNVPSSGEQPIAIPKLIGYNYNATNVIFTESYTTYPLLKITLASFYFTGPYYKEYSFYMTPTMVNTIFADHTYLNFGNPYRSEKVIYTKGSDTEWTRYNSETNIYVKNVYGLTFINYDVTETLLYNRSGYGSANVTFDPPTGHTFDEYDYILFSTCDSAPYYQTPSYNFYCKKSVPDTEMGSGFGDINQENFFEKCIRLTSQSTNYYCYFNKTTISSLPYSVVVALTLTPKSGPVTIPDAYEKLIADPFRAKYSTYWTDWYYRNPNSHAYISNDTLMYDLDFRMVTRSGHEGYCFDMAYLNLESGKTYKISFDFFVSAGSWSNSYRWGLKYSSTQIESTNTAFNLDTDVTFARQTGWQTVELTFTANSNNYLAFCLSDSSSNALYACKNITIEEVT